MNGGFGNRPMVGLAKGLSWGDRFRRDVRALLAARENIADRYDPSGHALLWLDPWNGGKQSGLPLEACDPYFIEICRRIRFTKQDGRLVCWRANTNGKRVAVPDAGVRLGGLAFPLHDVIPDVIGDPGAVWPSVPDPDIEGTSGVSLDVRT